MIFQYGITQNSIEETYNLRRGTITSLVNGVTKITGEGVCLNCYYDLYYIKGTNIRKEFQEFKIYSQCTGCFIEFTTNDTYSVIERCNNIPPTTLSRLIEYPTRLINGCCMFDKYETYYNNGVLVCDKFTIRNLMTPSIIIIFNSYDNYTKIESKNGMKLGTITDIINHPNTIRRDGWCIQDEYYRRLTNNKVYRVYNPNTKLIFEVSSIHNIKNIGVDLGCNNLYKIISGERKSVDGFCLEENIPKFGWTGLIFTISNGVNAVQFSFENAGEIGSEYGLHSEKLRELLKGGRSSLKDFKVVPNPIP